MADYAITNVARRVVYTGSAGVGPYAFTFPVLINTDIAVYKNTTLLTLTTDYTVTISGTTGQGSVTLVSAATGTDRITIVGARSIQRSTDFVTGGDFFANTLNTELDSETIFIQQIAETAERGLKAPVTDPTSINMTLPVNTTRASKFLSFDADGNPQALNAIGTYKGNWATSTAYVLQDIVKDTSNNNIYICLTAHTSTGSQPISSNADVAKWSLLVDAASATTSATNAASSASAASTSATNAASSASAASTSASNASTSATTSSTQASNASTSATNAASSASAASSSATSASTSASTATTQASNASTSATVAASSASAASTSASNASTSASNASTSASAASTSATAAASSATTATTQASNASTSATNAATSASSASSAQTAAESARDATLAAYDSFDDRYLGSKTSDPALDNDGNALLAGALYFNSSSGVMRLYTGSAWVAAYVSGSGYLAASNNLSDLASASTARTNLGLGTAATTAATAYATSAQGTTADTAYADRLKWDGGATGLTAATGRTSLGLGTLATVSPTGTADATTFLRGDNSYAVVSVTPTAVSDQANSSTGYFDLPVGTTAQRPGSPTSGNMRYNTTTSSFEGYNGTAWGSIGGGASYTMKNRIINGAMTVSQRGSTSSTVSAYAYGVDRFGAYETTSATSVTVAQSSTAPTGFINSLLYTVGTGGTATAAQQAYIRTKIEGLNISDLAWGTASAATVTLSFWVRSSLTGTYCVYFKNSAQDRSYVSTYTISAANTWEQKTITVAGDTSGTWLTTNGTGIELGFDLGSGSNSNTTANTWAAGSFANTSAQANLIGTTGATFYITGVQLEVGSSATSFEYRLYGQELINCQRYYYRITATTSYQIIGTGYAETSTTSLSFVKFPVTMRTNPTALESSGTNSNYFVTYQNQSTANTATPYFYQTMTTEGCGVYFTHAALLTAGNGIGLRIDVSGAYLGWSAEL